MVDKDYCPEKGDIVWLNFNPQSGHEQRGKRPAICISPYDYNKKVGLALFCPITSQIKAYPFEVLLPDSTSTGRVIISDQIKSLDWKVRGVEFIEKAPLLILEETIMKLSVLIKT